MYANVGIYVLDKVYVCVLESVWIFYYHPDTITCLVQMQSNAINVANILNSCHVQNHCLFLFVFFLLFSWYFVKKKMLTVYRDLILKFITFKTVFWRDLGKYIYLM